MDNINILRQSAFKLTVLPYPCVVVVSMMVEGKC